MTPQQMTESINALLAKHGVPVGSEVTAGPCDTIKLGVAFCPYSLTFDASIPAAFQPVIARIADMFRSAGLTTDVATWAHLGEAGANIAHVSGCLP